MTVRTKTFPTPRYVVREVAGRTNMGHGTNATGGTTVSVHDSWNGYRTVGLFRTEDHSSARPYGLRLQLAHAWARATADTLEAWYGPESGRRTPSPDDNGKAVT